jgi:hypothetical protein
MSMPSFATNLLMKWKIPTANYIIPCVSHKQYGDLTLVINGQDYVLDNEDWMFPAQ